MLVINKISILIWKAWLPLHSFSSFQDLLPNPLTLQFQLTVPMTRQTPSVIPEVSQDTVALRSSPQLRPPLLVPQSIPLTSNASQQSLENSNQLLPSVPFKPLHTLALAPVLLIQPHAHQMTIATLAHAALQEMLHTPSQLEPISQLLEVPKYAPPKMLTLLLLLNHTHGHSETLLVQETTQLQPSSSNVLQ